MGRLEIFVTKEAFVWFQKEMEIKHGDHIRFYARYGGSSPFHEAFSLGMNREEPNEIGTETVIENVHFYIEKDDEWFFNEHNLYVTIDTKNDEIAYEYKK